MKQIFRWSIVWKPQKRKLHNRALSEDNMKHFGIQTLETTFRGYPRKAPYSWALHYNISFACPSDDLPEFLSHDLVCVHGFFQIPQHFSPVGVWGQFEKVDVGSDNDIGLGPRRVWRTHGQVHVYRDVLWDAWARIKVVYTFNTLPSPVWFKTDVAFRCVYVENPELRWGTPYCEVTIPATSFCYSGISSSYSVETNVTGHAGCSVAGLLRRLTSH